VAAILESLTQERARLIGDAARRRVLEDHTYTRRAQQVSAILNELAVKANATALQVLA
jgi:spore maturation protein CgeB